MVRKILLLVALMMACSAPGQALALSLTGKWNSSDHGVYYVRQLGNAVYMMGEFPKSGRHSGGYTWTRVCFGNISGDRLRLNCADVPKGRRMQGTAITARIVRNGNVLTFLSPAGAPTGKSMARFGYRAPAVAVSGMPRQPHRQPSPRPRQTRQPVMTGEFCTNFDPELTGHDSSMMFFRDSSASEFGPFRGGWSEADRAMRIVIAYRFTQYCTVSNSKPTMSYFLSNRRAPRGAMRGEDCTAFNPSALRVARLADLGIWVIKISAHRNLLVFGKTQSVANAALAVIRKYGFTHLCSVGRPNPPFTYFRR